MADVLLVSMPWSALDTPSLALGILHRLVEEQRVRVRTRCANLDFFDWASRTLGLSVDDYDMLATQTYFEGYGDLIFSAALDDQPAPDADPFAGQDTGLDGRQLELCASLYRLSPRFLNDLADDIVAGGPAVVGFTTTFQQNVASLGLARRIKERAPATTIVFGGANCDGEQGAALHRNFGFVDFVVRGEGESAFPALLGVLNDDGDPAGVPGLCWRDADGAGRANPMSRTALPTRRLTAPVFDEYFERLAKSEARHYLEPKLVLEGARGCWWGEKHHCTFCGLNGSFMTFRAKDADDFLREILDQAVRHQLLDIIVVDNILDMGYLRSLLPAMAGLDHDFRVHYEIKSNLGLRQLEALAAAGLVQVQPGIESLNSRVLQLMDKGVTGCQNVRHLRDAQSAGVWATWNYLFGFPGETSSDYDPVIAQMPALHHLNPPETVSRIAVERFSPYFDRPELGFATLRPAGHYARTYALPESELHDLAYIFDAPPAGLGGDGLDRLIAAVDDWRTTHVTSRLTQHDLGDRIVLVSRRSGFDWTVKTITDPVELAAFRLLADPRGAESLAQRLGVPRPRVEALLADWRSDGIVFEDAARFVHVAVLATNGELTRVGADLPLVAAPAPTPAARSVTLDLWRDHDDVAGRLPGMRLAPTTVTGDVTATVAELFRSGVRRASLAATAVLTGDADPALAVRTLEVVRELTACGVRVDWQAVFDVDDPAAVFGHLHPPAGQASWASTFFLGKFHYRRGPGFMEVRDHRSGILNRIVIDEPEYLDAIETLMRDPAAAIPGDILDDLVSEALVIPVGDRHWWAPYRPYRWPQPPFHV